MRRIDRYLDAGPFKVPLDRAGRVLDRGRVAGGFSTRASSPHGPRRFILGGTTKKIVLDYGGLPDGRYWTSADEEPRGLGLVPGDFSAVHGREVVVEASFRLIERSLDVLERCGDPHRPEIHDFSR